MSVEVQTDKDFDIQGMLRNEFFPLMARQGLALTFDDILLDTAWSDVGEQEVNLTTRFSKNVELKVPFASAAMDTITTSPMAIAMAKMGGIGVIGAYLSPEDQKVELRRVKRALHGLIEDPICVRPDQSLESILNMCEDKGFGFRSFPVTENGTMDGKFVGIITQKNFTFHQHSPGTLVKEAMTSGEKVISGKPKTKFENAYAIMREHDILTLPLLKGDKVTGLYVWTDVNQAMHRDVSSYNVDEKGRLRVAAAVATDDDDAIARVKLWRKYVDAVVVDTSKGDHKYGRGTFAKLVELYPEIDFIPGNITNGKSAVRLARMGAAAIKVGQGGGSICSTRDELGYGCPQATAVYRVTKALESYDFDIPVCSDGGITKRGDIPIVIATGAENVMSGFMFAGTDETPGLPIDIDGIMHKMYRGQGSKSAMEEGASGQLRYGEMVRKGALILPEGVESVIECRGPVNKVIGLMAIALRKSMSGYDARTIKELPAKARFQHITPAGQRESSPHDIKIVAIPSNYFKANGR